MQARQGTAGTPYMDYSIQVGGHWESSAKPTWAQRGGPERQGKGVVGEPAWTAHKSLRGHRARGDAMAGWLLGAGVLGGRRAGPREPVSPARCDRPTGSRAGPVDPLGAWRRAVRRYLQSTWRRWLAGQGSGVDGWARWFSCIHGRMSSGLSGGSRLAHPASLAACCLPSCRCE